MENLNPPEAETVSVEVTRLPLTESAPAPVTEPAQPEILVVHEHIEQTPEGNTQWQERIETTLRTAAENQQNQTNQVIQLIQGFRETMSGMQTCLLKIEGQLVPNPPLLQNQPEELPATVPVTEPAAIPPPVTNPENQPPTRKKRRRI